MSNCKETSIPQVDNSQLPCCEIVNTFCVSHAEELPNLGLPENSLVSDILNTIDENISDIGSYISDISLVGNDLTIVGENSAFSGVIDFSGLQLVVANITDFPAIPQNTSDLVNDGSDGTSTYVENDELAGVATSGDYSDLSNTPIFKVVENEYTDVVSMYADQGNQTNTFIQYVTDASGFPNTPIIVGDKYFEYLGTTNGNETDYRMLSDEESAPIVNNITKTSDIPTNDGATGVSPYAELVDLPVNVSELNNDSLYINESALPQNTVIRGLQSTITTARLLGSSLFDNTDGSSWSIADSDKYIKNFEIVGDEIRCLINKRYKFKNSIFKVGQAGELCTHYYDYDGMMDRFTFQEFRYNTNIVEVEFPEATGSLQFVFQDCTSLTKALIPRATVVDFNGCTNLSEVDFRFGKTIATLKGCANLPTTLRFPNAESFGLECFVGTPVQVIHAPELLTIGQSFNNGTGNTSIVELNAPKVRSLTESTFRNANNLTKIWLPECESVDSVGRVFEVDNCEVIYLPKCKTFGDDAINNGFFTGATVSGMTLVVNKHLKTSNGGSENANVADARSKGVNIVYVDDYNREEYMELTNPPLSASDTGTAGQIAYDSSYVYICTATNTWVRASISTW